ncbi:MAG: proline dehydrogenase family protein [Cyclonatronaceae bacterium]
MKLPYALAKRFVAGESLQQAVPKVADLNEYGIKVTLDLLGEDVTERSTADETLQHYIELLEGIHEQGIDASISIKLTMLGLSIDRDYCRDNLFKLLDAARKFDQFVRIDMESSAHTQSTIDLFAEAFQQYGKHVGIVIQAYLHRTKADIDRLAGMGADVRLCKGAYGEPERIALQKMSDIRQAYKEYAQILLDKTLYPRIATHDDELLEWTKTYITENNIGKSRFEFQMLYGMRLETCKELAREGYNVRVYVPYGTMWFPYFSRRLKERKENIWFVLSTMFQK